MMEFELHPEAYRNLYELADYIADDSPEAAKRVVKEIFEAFAGLVILPHTVS